MESIVVAVYEDGTRYECAASMWRSANEESEEAMEAMARMLAGETVMMGGGAQPLCRLWIAEMGEKGKCYQDGGQFYAEGTGDLLADYGKMVAHDYDTDGSGRARERFLREHGDRWEF